MHLLVLNLVENKQTMLEVKFKMQRYEIQKDIVLLQIV